MNHSTRESNSQVPMVLRTVLLTAMCILATQMTSFGQSIGMGQLQETRSNLAAYHFYAKPGDLTMIVSVWGTVRYPGQYEVREGTDLGSLLSLAGGPQLTTRQRRDRREITVTLSRQLDEGRSVVYQSLLDSMIVSDERYPSLVEGDVLTVETVEQRGFNWRDIFPIVAAVGSVALAIERIASTR